MAESSDALVIYGITGDLAYKKIFPALQALVRRGRLTVPVIGVARSAGSVQDLIERARASLVEAGSSRAITTTLAHSNDCARRSGAPSGRCTTWPFLRRCSRWSSST
jgi:glucose-6-phosphate 1-dehydrogenase